MDNAYVRKVLNTRALNNMAPTILAWARGENFSDLSRFSNLAEGDVIRFLRQVIDIAQQVRRSTDDPELKEKLDEGIKLLDRDVVAVRF